MTKTPKFHRKFDKEFKMQAIKMVLEEGNPIVEVVKKLEINQGQIHKWKQKYKADGPEAFPGKGHESEAEEEIKRLKKELADAEEERDILKKAVAIFSKTHE